MQNFLFVYLMKRRGLKLGEMALDKQQVEAVVACEDSQLVLASAGSGKTMSLLAKIEYLVRELGISPEKILAISFTKKTVDELIERCSIKGVELRTFHALGNSILREFQSENLSKRQLVGDIDGFLKETLLYLCEDEAFARKVNNFILFYLSAPVVPGEYKNLRQKVGINRLCLRAELRKKTYEKIQKSHARQSLNQVPIRSKEAELVANWLYINQIDYEYLKPLDKYKPDFTLNNVYLDIFSLDKNGNSLLGNEYQKEATWRRKYYKRNKLKHIELQSWRWADCLAFSHLRVELKKNGIEPKRRAESGILSLIQECYAGEFEQFLKMLSIFLSLYKNGLHSIRKLRKRITRMQNYNFLRATLFLDIFEKIYVEYSEYLETERLYDFADMINEATELVKNEKDCMLGYEYILLDEVQDLSPNRLRLVREILRKNPSCRLFAVGDDWQSIYRFTGSNLELIERFSEYFGRRVRRSLIETTHRFGNPTVKLSSSFIQKNPMQAHKRVRGLKTQTPIKIILSRPSVKNRNSESDGFRQVIADLQKEYGAEIFEMQLQIISRFNKDLQYLSDAPEANISEDSLGWRLESGKMLHFEFCSIHKSKGITRDIVIALNMNDSLMGMPAQRESDPLIDMLLSEKEPYRYAEERRLFYVALTRARKATYLIAKEKTPSPFLFELSPELSESRKNRCPRCETGELIRKTGKFGSFRYCSNYFYGYNYLKREK